MILDIWWKIAYVVQLLAASLLLMIPARKREKFLLNIGIIGILFIALSYLINVSVEIKCSGIYTFLYWAAFLIVPLIFIYVGSDCSLKYAAYCAICACAMQHIAFDFYLIGKMVFGDVILLSILTYLIVYTLFYLFFAKKLMGDEHSIIHRDTVFPIVTIITLVWLLSILEDFNYSLFAAQTGHRIIYRLIDALCCFYVLWVQLNQKKNYILQHELEVINYMMDQQKRQYKFTSETIGNINRKCHDLKYQIRSFRQITDEKEKDDFLMGLEQDIMIYDTAMKTGNQALDIVLMEKGMFCKEHNIQWTCMADGFQLDFMKNEDIYSIFGNALDNAITAVMKLENEEKRIISVKMINQDQLLTIQIQNYFNQHLKFVEGLPLTTKKDKQIHGYGMKSIQYTAQKYDGIITVNIEKDIFMLQILLPMG
ncbi:MAG: ATP-binding protein [Hespellia sp.]|nr:ATP-binding protein [Hespellia sp.]